MRRRRHPLLVALADDAQHVVGPVNGADLKRGGLADAQTARIHNGETRLVNRVADAAEQEPNLIVRQRVRQPLLPWRSNPFFPQTAPRHGRACGDRGSAGRTDWSERCRVQPLAGANRANRPALLPRRADRASGGNAWPACRRPGCRSSASPQPSQPGSCPRSSAHVVATWWSPFVDGPTGYCTPAGAKGYVQPPNDFATHALSAKPFRPSRLLRTPRQSVTGAKPWAGMHFLL